MGHFKNQCPHPIRQAHYVNKATNNNSNKNKTNNQPISSFVDHMKEKRNEHIKEIRSSNLVTRECHMMTRGSANNSVNNSETSSNHSKLNKVNIYSNQSKSNKKDILNNREYLFPTGGAKH
jgi:hypothetical protein